MAEIHNHSGENGQVMASPAQKSAKPVTPHQKRGPSIHQIYALPAPVRTFPLPVFYPSNPISFLNVAYAWLRQILSPPPAEPAIVHQGVWDEATGSVHISDEKSMRALWEQGFYGKGSLSRSEPNWLKRELVRKGRQETHVSEILTSQRREERAQAKWERARLEQEAIRQTRLHEARLAASAQALATQSAVAPLSPQTSSAVIDVPVETLESPRLPCSEAEPEVEVEVEVEAENRDSISMTDSISHGVAGTQAETVDAPIGPLELLRLPNSEADRVARLTADNIAHTVVGIQTAVDAPVGPLELLRLPNSEADRVARLTADNIAHTIVGIQTAVAPPVEPLELLRLPNSVSDRITSSTANRITQAVVGIDAMVVAPIGPLELLRLPNSEADRVARSILDSTSHTVAVAVAGREAVKLGDTTSLSSGALSFSLPDTHVDGSETATPDAVSDADGSVLDEAGHDLTPEDRSCCDSTEEKFPKQQKSVRFSVQVESTTFSSADPPSPHFSDHGRTKPPTSGGHVGGLVGPGVRASPTVQQDDAGGEVSEEEIVNVEHLQLTPEESFFLAFGLGALSVREPGTGRVLANQDLLTLFRRYSYFPPRLGPDEPELEPDDDFLVHYAVYHHFRSLGWVPRAGIKFGVDWLLYTRGPVFDHAEFGLIVIPSYSDAWWKARGTRGPDKTWHWLHSVVRVLSHVMKSLVLVYVDVPPRPQFEAALEKGYVEALKLYRVREVMVKRWSSNRNR
ncbi:hypothetical protein E4U42_003098 [Claviceps africana]|uniref:tRNA-intron lyase n=1 Tax=Claviceps africana TaxID=83212 RepID=A0A8K0JIA3_9HYPO|nr:hypothetical protein E4U42_003098 [Claviceps africana]